jgi:hypothetical protein
MISVKEIVGSTNVWAALGGLLGMALSLRDFLDEGDRTYEGIRFSCRCCRCSHKGEVRAESRTEATAHFSSKGWDVAHGIGYALRCPTCALETKAERYRLPIPVHPQPPLPRQAPLRSLTLLILRPDPYRPRRH